MWLGWRRPDEKLVSGVRSRESEKPKASTFLTGLRLCGLKTFYSDQPDQSSPKATPDKLKTCERAPDGRTHGSIAYGKKQHLFCKCCVEEYREKVGWLGVTTSRSD